MTTEEEQEEINREIAAIGNALEAMKPLDEYARARIAQYITRWVEDNRVPKRTGFANH